MSDRTSEAKAFESRPHIRSMKRIHAVPLVVTASLAVLFFFPQPASNLIAYSATMLILGVIIALTVRWAYR